MPAMHGVSDICTFWSSETTLDTFGSYGHVVVVISAGYGQTFGAHLHMEKLFPVVCVIARYPLVLSRPSTLVSFS